MASAMGSEEEESEVVDAIEKLGFLAVMPSGLTFPWSIFGSTHKFDCYKVNYKGKSQL